MNRCKGKKHFDTEYEATRSAYITTDYFKAEMEPYPCGNHWHIANKDKSMRGKHPRPPEWKTCKPCNCTMKYKKWHKHQLTHSHIKNVRRASIPWLPT